MRLLIGLTLIASLALPAAAHASSVDVETVNGSSAVRIRTDDERNTITVAGTPTRVAFGDTQPISVGADPTGQCTGAGTVNVTCTVSAGYRSVQVEADGPTSAPDSVDASGLTGYPATIALPSTGEPTVGLTVFGLGGAVTVRGSAAGDLISVPGDSTVRGGGGDDLLAIRATGNATAGDLFGEDGNDALFGWASGVTLDGGAGSDLATTRGNAQPGPQDTDPIVATVDPAGTTTGNGAAGQDVTLTAVEGFVGGPGADRLRTVGEGANLLVGLGGGDRLDGGPGADALYGFRGPDVATAVYAAASVGSLGTDTTNAILAADGTRDTIDCGVDAIVQVDSVDALTNCPAEGDGTAVVRPPATVEVPGPAITVPVPVPGPTTQVLVPVPAAPADTTAPTAARLSAPAPRAAALRRNGRYTVSLTPSETSEVEVTLSARAGRVASIARAGDLVLANRAIRATAGRRASVRVTVPRSLRRLLRAGRRLSVRVTLTDASGNETRVVRRVRIRR